MVTLYPFPNSSSNRALSLSEVILDCSTLPLMVFMPTIIQPAESFLYSRNELEYLKNGVRYANMVVGV